MGTKHPFANEYRDKRRRGFRRAALRILRQVRQWDGMAEFHTAARGRTVAENVDSSHGMARTEVRSKHGDSQLGHVFPDGPRNAAGIGRSLCYGLRDRLRFP